MTGVTRPLRGRSRTPLLALALAAGILTALSVARVSFAQPSPRTRVIPYHVRAPLQDRLEPGDEVVVVTREYDVATLDRRPTFDDAVRWISGNSSMVAVVTVDQVASGLVGGGTWIRTSITGTVDRWIYPAPPAAPDMRRVSTTLDGGEVTLDHVRVRTRGTTAVEQRGTYLIFFWDRPEGENLHVGSILRVTNGRLQPTWQPELVSRGRERPISDGADIPNALVNHTLKEVEAKVLRAKRAEQRRSPR